MNNRKCYLCGNSEIEIIHKGTRDNPNIDVLECKKCGLVFLSSFEHIKDEVYEESEMHEEKKELNMEKYRENTKEDDIRRVECLKEIIKNKDVLDFGCGNGGFIKYSYNIVNSINGVELEKKERDYLKSEGFDVRKELKDLNKKFDVITLFHVLEHLKDPINNLKYFKNFLNENGEIIIEVPNSNDALLRLYKSQKFADFTYWSFHLFLYNESTLKSLAEKCGLKVKWTKQIQRYSLANHLYWLSEGKPGGHVKWDFIDTLEINKLYKEKLENMNLCDTLMISLGKM